MSTLKKILNHPEEIADARLREVCASVSARVFAKVRVADVLEVNGSGASSEEFGFALRSHFDFVVTGEDKVPLFVVEVDGPSHEDERQRRRDSMKDALCERHELPILRVILNHLKREYRGMALITWFVEMWFLQRAIDEAVENGQISADTGAAPMWVFNIPGQARKFPLMLGIDARETLRKLAAAGRTLGWMNTFAGYDRHGNWGALGFVSVATDKWATSLLSAKRQQFPVPLDDLLQELLPVELLSSTKAVLRGEEQAIVGTEALASLKSFARRFRVASMFSSPPFVAGHGPGAHEDLFRRLQRDYDSGLGDNMSA